MWRPGVVPQEKVTLCLPRHWFRCSGLQQPLLGQLCRSLRGWRTKAKARAGLCPLQDRAGRAEGMGCSQAPPSLLLHPAHPALPARQESSCSEPQHGEELPGAQQEGQQQCWHFGKVWGIEMTPASSRCQWSCPWNHLGLSWSLGSFGAPPLDGEIPGGVHIIPAGKCDRNQEPRLSRE